MNAIDAKESLENREIVVRYLCLGAEETKQTKGGTISGLRVRLLTPVDIHHIATKAVHAFLCPQASLGALLEANRLSDAKGEAQVSLSGGRYCRFRPHSLRRPQSE